MMKAKTAFALALSAVLALGTLAGCGGKQNLTDEPLTGDLLADFSKGDPGKKVLFPSDGWSNGSVFNTVWTEGNLTYSDGAMHLGIKEEEKKVYVNDVETTYNYTSGEARTAYYYGYGDYEVRMKPTATAGTASTFFICTGPYDKTPEGVENPWDEIDIEFLGKDPTKVQFNYYADSTGEHEHMYDLGFDASKEFHNYGFRWTESYITWFVDGEPVYRVDKANVKSGEAFPKTAGRILMNYWCGTKDAEGWMGKFAAPDGKTADYEWVKTSAVKQDPPMGDPYEKEEGNTFDGDWSTVTAVDLAFADAEEYQVALSEDKKSADITYTDVAGNQYHNVSMDVTEAAADHGFMQLTAKNNGTETVDFRINVQDASNKCLNAAATQDGDPANTDLINGGSFFTIEAGKTIVCEVKFVGAAAKVELMIDSSTNKADKRSGNVTVSGLKFAGEGSKAEEPDTSDLPEANNQGVTVDGTKLDVKGNTDDYVVISNETTDTLRIVYANLQGGKHQNLWMDATSLARTKNVFSVKVTNNGTEKLTFRIDIESATVHGTNKIVACNESATQDGTEVWTDLEWGGSKFEIEAGKTAVCAVTYDTTMGPTNVKMYFDSCINEDAAKHSGDVTLAEMAFSGNGSYEPSDPSVSEGEPVALTFSTNTTDATKKGYTFNVTAGEENKSWTLNYAGKGNTYAPATAECAALAAGKDTFTITIKNNKDTAVTVRVDVQGTTKVDTSNGDDSGSGTDCTNKSATCTGGSDLYTDLKWGGTKVTLAAGEEVTLTITYDEAMDQGAVKNILVFVDSMGGDTNDHDASVTVSGFIFSKAQAAD